MIDDWEPEIWLVKKNYHTCIKKWCHHMTTTKKNEEILPINSFFFCFFYWLLWHSLHSHMPKKKIVSLCKINATNDQHKWWQPSNLVVNVYTIQFDSIDIFVVYSIAGPDMPKKKIPILITCQRLHCISATMNRKKKMKWFVTSKD